jgi:hypothetical protein
LVKGKRTDLVNIVEKHQSTIKTLEKEVAELRYRMARSQVKELLQSVLVIKDVKILTAVVDGLDKGGLRNLADELKAQLGQRRCGPRNCRHRQGRSRGDGYVRPDLQNPRRKAGEREFRQSLAAAVEVSRKLPRPVAKTHPNFGKALESVGPFVERSLAG